MRVGVKYNMHASFVEVHNEWVRDLIEEPDENGNQTYLRVSATGSPRRRPTRALASGVRCGS